MYVVKRNGREQRVRFDKITARVQQLAYGLDHAVEPVLVAQKVCLGVYRGVTTVELDNLASEVAAHMISEHPDYGVLAARVSVSNLHKQTSKDWVQLCRDMHAYVDPVTKQPAPLLSDATMQVVEKHGDALASHIVYARDMDYDFFGFKTLERAYLAKMNGKIVERPQHMLMRVAVGIHADDVRSVLETYDLMSEGFFTHASPTLFNAGTPHPQMSSCFLLQMQADSIDGICDTLKQCAQISRSAGGIGLAVHKIRARGSYIRGTGGTSNGLVPMLRVFNNMARYVDQGGGKRKGAFAVYLEPWHADVFEWLDLRKNHGAEDIRARDLFFGLWTPDLFMHRVYEDEDWSLFCPNEAPGLADVWGDEFEKLYERYEREGKARKTVKAQELWRAILEAQMETGTPYMLYKDECNRKSNQQNLGTIQCSNLCTEIVEYTSPNEVAVCNLASVALSKFVDTHAVEDGSGEVLRPVFNHTRLAEVVRVVTRNLNKIIDKNEYPVPEAKASNLRNRPIGIGVQGLADTFIQMRYPFDSQEARVLNREIFETIYFAAVDESCALAREFGPYETFKGSPASEGRLQPDLWTHSTCSDRWDWDGLRARVREHGLRNSLLTAPMPTASTSQILGNNECFEPYTSNLYVRRTLAGNFVCINRHLMLDLHKLGLWTPEMKNRLVAHKGSVQRLPGVPQWIKDLYKTVWEIKGKVLIDMAADRGPFIDQSQSFNVHMEDVTYDKLTSMHFYGWHKGLKTGMYYLRTRPAADPIQFTVDQEQLAASKAASQALGRDDDEDDKEEEQKELRIGGDGGRGPVATGEGKEEERGKNREAEAALRALDAIPELNGVPECLSCGS